MSLVVTWWKLKCLLTVIISPLSRNVLLKWNLLCAKNSVIKSSEERSTKCKPICALFSIYYVKVDQNKFYLFLHNYEHLFVRIFAHKKIAALSLVIQKKVRKFWSARCCLYISLQKRASRNCDRESLRITVTFSLYLINTERLSLYNPSPFLLFFLYLVVIFLRFCEFSPFCSDWSPLASH